MAGRENDSQILDVKRGRQAAGLAAAALIEAGPKVVGLGTGDTAAYFIRALAERVRGGLSGLRCVATSRRSAELGRSLGLQIIDLDELDPQAEGGRPIAVTVDGADEIDPELRLIKGAGGALLFEKLVAHASRQLVIVADRGKLVQRLGEKRGLPVEIVAFGARHTLARLRAQKGVEAAELRLRTPDNAEKPYLTDSGNQIVDVKLQATSATELPALQARLKALPGVIETGLFLSEATQVLIGDDAGHVEVRKRGGS
jgi:ribose 5-phosphate isomerase A